MRKCVPRPFVSDTSLKRIDREGLGKRRTGTTQVSCRKYSSPFHAQPEKGRLLALLALLGNNQFPFLSYPLTSEIPTFSHIPETYKKDTMNWRVKPFCIGRHKE